MHQCHHDSLPDKPKATFGNGCIEGGPAKQGLLPRAVPRLRSSLSHNFCPSPTANLRFPRMGILDAVRSVALQMRSPQPPTASRAVARPSPGVARMEQGPSLFASPWRHPRSDPLTAMSDFPPRCTELCLARPRARIRVEIFDERHQILGNRKALLAKFVSLTYRDSRGQATRSGEEQFYRMTVRSRTGTGTLKARRVSSVKAIEVATKATRVSASWLGVAVLTLVVAAHPAEAGKKPKTAPPAEPVVEFDKHEPMIVVVSVGQQKIDVYRGTTLVTTSAVSTGTAEHPTFIGAFSILEKQRWHHSNMYSAAPMPWMNRITWSGTALHAGVVPGYPASHGCIRLTYAFAPKFFDMSSVGDNVIVSRGRPKPTPIEHSALFQPLPPPPLPTVGELTPISPLESTSSRVPAIAAGTPGPVILARAEAPTAVESDAQSQVDEESASSQSEPASEPVEPHPHPDQDSDPNRVHAITPDTTSAVASHPVADPATASVGAVKDKTVAGTVAPAPAASTSDPSAPS